MQYGYTGKILHVDLSAGTLEVEEPPEEFYRKYLGGSALGLYYLFKHTPADTDPYGPENTLTFALSGITGAPISGQSRCTVVAKAPLTGGVGDSQAGGFWPAELKFAGFDAIVVRGTSPRPVYLWIKDGECELRDAAHLWGQPTSEVDRMLEEELGDRRIQVAQIGPAGEKLVRFAAIMNMAQRAHGRGGMGAVMGSKKLKAIVVRGSKRKLAMADAAALRGIMKAFQPKVQEDPDIEGLAHYGTPGIIQGQDEEGGLPTRNWQKGVMGPERAERISGEFLFDELLAGAAGGTQLKDGRDTCYSCAVRCKRVVDAEWEGRSINPVSGGPEYENIATLGSYSEVADLRAIAYANQLCNEYGVDGVSAGATMAFAMECFEKGLITEADTGGIRLDWEDAKAMVAMLEMTLRREGFGDVLAEGSYRAAEKIGNGAGQFFMGSKKQEAPAHMPQVKASMGLIYAVNPYGADHQSSEHDPLYTPENIAGSPDKYAKRMRDIGLTRPQPVRALNPEKAEFTLRTQYAYQAVNSSAVCTFVYGPGWQLMGIADLADVYRAVTGWEVTVDELLEVGARTVNMQRAFNAREGFTKDDDTLPRRFFDQPLQGGNSDGWHVDEAAWSAARDSYYEQANWDPETGNPTRATLEELGLGFVADAVGV